MSKDIKNTLLNDDTIRPQNAPMMHYLFEDGTNPFQQPYYFLSFSTTKTSSSDLQSLIDFLRTIIDHLEVLESSTQLLIFHADATFHVAPLMDTLKEDFGLPLKVFESGPLNPHRSKDFHILWKAYLKHGASNPRPYTNSIDLVYDIIGHDVNLLKSLRPIILQGIEDDPQMESLIQSLFRNNMNISQTAEEVYMHRNTVMNKLNVIEERTGLHLQSFHNAVAIYFLMRAK